MPSKSKSQKRLMAACSHGANYDSCPSEKVAKDFNMSDKGSKKKLPEKVHKKEKK